MKTGWETKNLEEVCEFRRGLTYSKNDEVDFSNNIVLRANNVEVMSGKLDFSELKYINEKIVIPEEKKVKKNSLIICTASGSKSHLGKVAYIDQEYPYAFGGFMGLLIPKQNLIAKFLFYLMLSDVYKEFIGALSDGVNINNLRFDDLGKFVVPIPPLPEQQRIVRILDEAFAGIAVARANAEKNIENSINVFISYMNQSLSQDNDKWEKTTIGENTDFLAGFAFQSAKYTESEDSIRLLRGDNIIQGLLRWDDVKKWPLADMDAYKDYQLRSGDVVLAMDRPWVKAGIKCSRITSDDLPCLLVQRTARLRCRKDLNNDFLFYLLRTDAFVRHILGVQTGLGVPHISGQQIKDFKFSRPSLTEQIYIVDSFKNISAETKRLESLYQQKIKALDELKKSLLHNAFTGQL